jgi:hypothetical protein
MAKQEAKLEALRQAALEVEQYENRIERITSVHRDCGKDWHWDRIATSPEPTAPPPTHHHEAAAQHVLDRFEPSWLDKLLRRVQKKRAGLVAGVSAGRATDAEANAQAQRTFADQHTDWAEMRDLAIRILAMDPAAFRDALEELNPFGELADLGSRISLAFRDDGVATASLVVNGESVIPAEVKSLLQSGKLSLKKMPQARFHELYQDYVAGATLRIARELLALLPIHTVYVTAAGNMLDPSSGHLKDQSILSLVVPRQTLETLRFEALDPSEALRNFNHRMDFKKTKGFASIEPLTP